MAGRRLADGGLVAGAGAVIIIFAGLLQGLVIHRRGDAGVVAHTAPFGARFFQVALALWLVPLLWSWTQFELFWNPV